MKLGKMRRMQTNSMMYYMSLTTDIDWRTLPQIPPVQRDHLIKSRQESFLKQHSIAWLNSAKKLNELSRKLEGKLENMLSVEEMKDNEIKEFDHETEIEQLHNAKQQICNFIVGNTNDDVKQKEIIKTKKNLDCSSKTYQNYLLNHEKLLMKELIPCNKYNDENYPVAEKIANTFLHTEIYHCPNAVIEKSLEDDWNILNTEYEQKLQKLGTTYENILRTSNGGWDKEEFFIFKTVRDVYPKDMINNRCLFHDMISKYFQKINITDMIKLETWVDSYASYKQQKLSILKSWSGHKDSMNNKVNRIVTDIKNTYSKRYKEKMIQHQQQQLCSRLHKQVEKYRKEKSEHMNEVKRNNLQILKDQERLKLHTFQLQKKEAEHRKKAVKEYYEGKLKEHKLTECIMAKELIHLRKQAEKRKPHIHQRVMARKKMYSDKQEKKLLDEEAKIKELTSKMEKINLFFAKVAPSVAQDLERSQKDTKSSTLKKTSKVNNLDHKSKGRNFQLYSFSDDQISMDPRLRLEQKLREADILDSSYAQVALKQVKTFKSERTDASESQYFPILNGVVK